MFFVCGLKVDECQVSEMAVCKWGLYENSRNDVRLEGRLMLGYQSLKLLI